MHYTSIENIHKVISPLLEDLQKEFDSIRAIQVKRTRDKNWKNSKINWHHLHF